MISFDSVVFTALKLLAQLGAFSLGWRIIASHDG